MAVRIFFKEYRRYPIIERWRQELTGDSGSIVNHKQKVFLDLDDPTLLDPWGNPYQFSILDTGEKFIPMVYSMGADGVSASYGNDPDDISSWRDPVEWRKAYRRPIEISWWMVVAIGFLGLYVYGRHWARNP